MRLADILQRIEGRLVALGLSAAAASKMAGKPEAIRNIRRAVKIGHRQGVSSVTIAALAPVLQTTEGWLLTGQGGSGEEIAAEAANSSDRLKQAMAERGIQSGAELARRSGIPPSTVNACINGGHTPPLDVCMKIGQTLGVSGTWIFQGNGPREDERTATPSEIVFAVLEEAFLVTASPLKLREKSPGLFS
jgi:transcriptional regulator with XRE-family HTH domain